jgi:hypothetical protein
MLARKKEQPVDMAGELLRFKGLIDAFIDGRIEQIKASRDGCDLPREIIKQMVMGAGTCPCSCVAALLRKEAN